MCEWYRLKQVKQAPTVSLTVNGLEPNKAHLMATTLRLAKTVAKRCSDLSAAGISYLSRFSTVMMLRSSVQSKVGATAPLQPRLSPID